MVSVIFLKFHLIWLRKLVIVNIHAKFGYEISSSGLFVNFLISYPVEMYYSLCIANLNAS